MFSRFRSILVVTLFLAFSAYAWAAAPSDTYGSQNTNTLPIDQRHEADGQQKRRDALRAALKAQAGSGHGIPEKPVSAHDRNALREQLRQQNVLEVQRAQQ
jgi:hypothetical protein